MRSARVGMLLGLASVAIPQIGYAQQSTSNSTATAPANGEQTIVISAEPNPSPPTAVAPAPMPPPPPNASPARLPPDEPSVLLTRDGRPIRPGATMPYLGGPVPPFAHIERRPRTPLVIAGAAVFGAVYVGDALVGLLFSSLLHSSAWLAVPIAGPIIWGATEPGLSSSPGSMVLLAIDSLAQLGGVVMFAAGFLVQRQVLVMNPMRSTQSRSLQWAIVPGAPGAAFGASWVAVTF